MSHRLLYPIVVAVMVVLSNTGCRHARPTSEVYPTVGTPMPSTDIYPPLGSASVRADQWVCPMHPRIRQSEPGKCSMCGMDLVRLSELSGAEKASSGSEHSHSPGSGHSSGSGGGCCG